ncbi:MAG: glutaminyl-tRNA synthetase, partial [Rhizobacter sp.]|nr:glutaminyl-tRNA synthetase [Rhizobacter sp.]
SSLGRGPGDKPAELLFFASDYFEFMHRAAVALIEGGHAYVDEQTPEQMRALRGSLTEAGIASPFRDRSVADNLARFEEMRAGKHADGAMVLRAKIDMASPNINLRDPAIYRIKHAVHHNPGNTWCIYPMYTFAHPIEDALEKITHSLCTLEFEDQRPFYDWLLERLAEAGLLAHPLPRQYEFARLNLTYVITSKRKLRALVEGGHVDGWDDPRMPTLVGMRRRGYTPRSIQSFCELIGVSKADSWIDYSTLDMALRNDLEGQAVRAMAVLDPVALRIENWADMFGSDSHLEACSAPAHPSHPELGHREFVLGREIWIERDDFAAVPPKGFFRLSPPRTDPTGAPIAGSKVRLKYGWVVECTGAEVDASGAVTTVLATLVPDTKSGTPGADAIKVKGVITWVSTHDGVPAEVRLYDRLFSDAHPDAGGKDFLESLNPASKRVAQGFVEPSAATVAPDVKLQFERHGYFVADRADHAAGRPVFNRTTTLRDTWSK